jgi:hypothetical protein
MVLVWISPGVAVGMVASGAAGDAFQLSLGLVGLSSVPAAIGFAALIARSRHAKRGLNMSSTGRSNPSATV